MANHQQSFICFFNTISISISISILLLLFTSLFSSSFVVSAFGFDKTSLFTNSHSVIDLDRTRLSFISPEAADSCPWVVLFYDSMCGHCREFSGPFSTFAEKELLPRGVFVGAINCAAQESLCVASNVSDVPTIFVGLPKRNKKVEISSKMNNQLEDQQDTKNFYDSERKKAINDLIKDASPFIKSKHGGGKDLRVSNNHQNWRVATSEIAQDASDPQIIAHVKKIFDTEWSSANFPAVYGTCKEVVGTLCLKKQQLIEFKNSKSNNKNVDDDAKKSSPSSVLNKNLFVPPPNHPCPQDLAGALYIALKHEVAVSFSTALSHALAEFPTSSFSHLDDEQNREHHHRLKAIQSSQKYQNLLHTVVDFLSHIHAALPELRAGQVLEILKQDPLAPTKTEDGSWGYKIYKTMFIAGNHQLKTSEHFSQMANADIEQDFAVFDDEHREEQEKLHEFYSPPITSVVWSSCRGSTPNYRGYTCGLWMLFHTVLSNAPHTTAPKALRALHDYILHFFMCLECRVHFSQFQFQSFYDNDDDDDFNRRNHHLLAKSSNDNSSSKKKNKKTDMDAVMWLYHAHNAVNRRLAIASSSSSSSTTSTSSSSSSTDPLVPKVQFPPPDLCPGACNPKSPERQLFMFLKHHYNWRKITRSLSFCLRQKMHNSKNWFDQLKAEGRLQQQHGDGDDYYQYHFQMNFFLFIAVFITIVVGVWIFVAVKLGYWNEWLKAMKTVVIGSSSIAGKNKMHTV